MHSEDLQREETYVEQYIVTTQGRSREPTKKSIIR